jgi:hypothetical protein
MKLTKLLLVLLAILLSIFVIASCEDLLSANGGNGDDTTDDGGADGDGTDGGADGDGIPDDALEVVAGLFGIVDLVMNADDPVTGVSDEMPDGYPEGMSVTEIEEDRSYQITLQNFAPPNEESPPTVDGNMTITVDYTQGDSSLTLSLEGSFQLSGHSVSSVEVNATAEVPVDPDTGIPLQDGEPSATSGGFTVDGESYSLEDILNALEQAADEDQQQNGDQDQTPDQSIDAGDAHFVGVGGATTFSGGSGGTVIYSIDGETWGVDHVDRDADLFGVASNDAGTVMAVGAADFVAGKPTGVGYILRTTDMQTWTPVNQTPENHPFSAVAYGDDGSGGVWVAVAGDSFVCYSTDGGDNWSKISLPPDYSAQMLWDVAYGDGMWSVVGGTHDPMDPPVWLAMPHADLSQGLENWQVVSQPADPDGNGTGADHKFRGVTYTPGLGMWLAVGDHPHPFAVEWSGSLSDTATDASIPVLTQEREPRVVESLEGPDGTFYQLIGTSESGNGRLLTSAQGSNFWSEEYFETSYETPIYGIAGGPTGGSIRWVVVGGAGDIWTSDDAGSSWIQRTSDFYGMFDITYRP